MFRGFVVLLATLQIYANFGSPPSSPDAMANSPRWLFMGVLALLAAWVERSATVSTEGSRSLSPHQKEASQLDISGGRLLAHSGRATRADECPL